MYRRNCFTAIALVLVSLVMLSLFAAPLSAQSFYGNIVGTVTDTSGAIVPGATVTATDIGTNQKHSIKSDAAGGYRFVDLVPANYKVDVVMPGFKRFEQASVTVQIDSTVRVDAALQVGAATETVEVTTQPALLQTDSGTVGAEVEGQVVQQMPLNGRNSMNLIALVPGVIPESNTSGAALDNAGNHTAFLNWGGYSISGGIANYAAIFVDGGPANTLGGNPVGFIPTQDAIQEFKLENSVPSSEYGRFGGGVITMTTKSGANAFHASAYEYLRNTILNANYFFTKASEPAGTVAPRAPFHQSQYGAVASGPIKRDKAFFFFSYEKFRLREGVPIATNVPGDGTHGTTNMVGGIFADTVNGKAVTITDYSGKCAGITHNTVAGTWTIPTGCFDPTSVVMQGYSPGPNTTPSATINNNFVSSPIEGNTAFQYNGRIDYNINEKQHLFGRYTYWNHHDIGQYSFYQYQLPFPSQYGGTSNYNHSIVIGETDTLNPTTILDSRISYLRSQWVNAVGSFNNVNLAPFGTNYTRLAPGTPGGFTWSALPDLSFTGIHALYNYNPIASVQLIWWENYAADENVTKIVGSHTFKIGGDVNRRMHAGIALFHNASGFSSFNSSTTGDEYASFLLGQFTSDNVETGFNTATYELAAGAYATDTWKVNRNLTLNLGVRWETPGGFIEKHDRQSVLLPNIVDTYTGFKGTVAASNSALAPSRSSEPIRYNLFSPRVSFAERLGTSSVVRGGFGITWLPYDETLGLMADESPVSAAITTSTNPASPAAPTFFQQNPWPLSSYPNGIIQPAGHATTQAWTQNFLGQVVSSPVPSKTMAYMSQYNLTYSRQWKGDWLTEVTWAGSKGTHLVAMGIPNGSSFANNLVSLNEIPSQDYTPSVVNTSNVITTTGGIATVGPDSGSSITNAASAATLAANPACAAYGKQLYGALYLTSAKYTPTVGQCLTPYPQFQQFNNAASFSASSHYDALYFTAQKRFRTGGTLNANYALSHMVSDTDQATSGVGTTQDFYNMAAEKSVSTYDVKNRFNLSYVLELPFGKGKRWLNNGGAANEIAGGWSVNGVTFWQSGFPLPMAYSSNALTTNFGAGGLRPNYVAGCNKKLGVTGSTFQKYTQKTWFNAACFTQPGNFAYGNQPRVDPILRGMANQDWDFAVQKVTDIKEKASVQFRAEFFNLFNHTNFPNPGTTMAGSNYNTIPGTSTVNPRLVQLSLRVNY